MRISNSVDIPTLLCKALSLFVKRENGVGKSEFQYSQFEIHSIVSPICRAVPEIVFIAASKLVVFKS